MAQGMLVARETGNRLVGRFRALPVSLAIPTSGEDGTSRNDSLSFLMVAFVRPRRRVPP